MGQTGYSVNLLYLDRNVNHSFQVFVNFFVFFEGLRTVTAHDPYGGAKALNKTESGKPTVTEESSVPSGAASYRIVIFMINIKDSRASLVELLAFFVRFHLS